MINPINQPVNQGIKKSLCNPTLMTTITKDMHIDIITAMQKPLNSICRILKIIPSPSSY
jgi:hypothetical protein